MDRFEELRTFAHVARHGVNGAARALHLAPSAVSRRIRDLERRLETELFTRTGRTMVLTEAGSAFLETSRAILERLEEAEGRIRDAQNMLVGRIRIAAPLSFGMRSVVPALSSFLAQHPRVDLDLDLDDRRVDIARDGFDLAIRIGDLASSSLRARRLGTYRFVVAASPSLLARIGPVSTLADLEGAPGLLYSPDPGADAWSAGAPDGTKREIVLAPRMVSNNGDSLREAAVAGLGILREPSFILEQALSEGSLVELLPDHDFGEVGAYALWPPHDYMPSKLRALIDHLAAALSSDR